MRPRTNPLARSFAYSRPMTNVPRFIVRLVHEVEIIFDDDRATEKSARHVAERCLSHRAFVGDSGASKTLGWWHAKLREATVEAVREVK